MVYRSVSERFRPSSLHPHHLITMRDLLNSLEGLFLLSPDTKAQPQFGFLNRRGLQSSSQSGRVLRKKSSLKLQKSLPSLTGRKSSKKKLSRSDQHVDEAGGSTVLRMLIRLWCHETTRVYLDRNTDSKERMWFLKLMETCIKYCFCGVGFDENAVPTGVTRPIAGHTANLGIAIIVPTQPWDISS